MVDLNLAQFFTGGPQRGQGINPSNPTPMQRGQGGMLSGPPSHADKLQLAMSQLDQNNVEDLAKLAKILQATGDTAGAVKVLKRIEDIRKAEVSASEKQAESAQEAKVRDVLLGIANAQGNTDAIKFLQAGGDLSKAQDVLFRAERTPQRPSAQASLSGEEFKNYLAVLDKVLSVVDEEDYPDSVSDKGAIYGRNLKKKNELRPVFLQAEELRRINPNMSLENALREAMSYKEKPKEKPKDKWKGLININPKIVKK